MTRRVGRDITGAEGAPRDEVLDHLADLVRLQGEFAGTIDQVDPTTPVPWCGRWRVRHLVIHLARIHHWAAAQARRTREVPLGRGPFDLPSLYRDCAAELSSTLSELGPDAIGATLLGPGPASFWRRRQLHETLVHLWDLRTAGGLPLAERPVLWADTVDEVVTVMQPRQVALGRMPPVSAGIVLLADDVGREWVLGPEELPAAVRVGGPARDLALLLWGRDRSSDLLRVDGDREVLDRVLAGRLIP